MAAALPTPPACLMPSIAPLVPPTVRAAPAPIPLTAAPAPRAAPLAPPTAFRAAVPTPRADFLATPGAALAIFMPEREAAAPAAIPAPAIPASLLPPP